MTTRLTLGEAAKHKLIAKIADAIDGRLHGYKVSIADWRTYCTCGGWSVEGPYGLADFDRHLAELALEAIHTTLNGDDND